MKMSSLPLSWMRESLECFLAEIRLNKSTPTVDAYGYDVSRFLEWLGAQGVKRLTYVRGAHVTAYLGECKADGKSDASINRYFMAIRCFCKWLKRSKRVTADIMEDVTAPRVRQKAPRIPTREEIARLLECPLRREHTPSKVRDAAILELLYSSGLRASELCALRLEDYTGDAVQVKQGKRGKTRNVPVNEEARKAVDVYIKEHRGAERGPLFQTVMGKALRRQFLGAMVGRYAEEAGVAEVTTHTLRHACATHFLDAGADLRLIQEILGHAGIASTERYTHLSSSKMQERFKQFSPRKKQE